MAKFLICFFFIAIVLFMAIARASRVFYLNAAKEAGQMPGVNYGNQKLTQDMLKRLPEVVQKWLKTSGSADKTLISKVFLKQKGYMRTKVNGKWMRLAAQQHFTVREPSFVWVAKIQAAPLIHITGRDKYQHGRGNMLVKLLSLFTVADAKGKETDQGSLLRYMAEIVWFPSAALADYISWEESGRYQPLQP